MPHRLAVRRKLCAEALQPYCNPERGLSILVLEQGDEHDASDLLLDKLEALGHDIITVYNEQEGESLLRQMISRLEFVDVILMRRPGWGLCKFCRTRLPARLQPTFIMHADDERVPGDADQNLAADWTAPSLVDMCLQYGVSHLVRPGSAPLMLVQVLSECEQKMPNSQLRKLQRRRSSLVSNMSNSASQDSGFEGDEEMQQDIYLDF